MQACLAVGTNRPHSVAGTGMGLGLSGFHAKPGNRPSPALDLDFARLKRIEPTRGPVPVFTRTSQATYRDAWGTVQTAPANVPRFNHAWTGTGWESRGLLLEEARTNILKNSETLATQSVTTAAVAYTLSFYGTGTVTLSGTSTAGPLVGTSDNQRASLGFTATAGTLTVTVIGTVKYAQLEAGAWATSWIPTTGSNATRTAETCSITGPDFQSIWHNDEGAFVVEYDTAYVNTSSGGPRVLQVDDGSNNSRITFNSYEGSQAGKNTLYMNANGVGQAFMALTVPTADTLTKAAFAFQRNDVYFLDRATSAPDTSANIPSLTGLYIGTGSDGLYRHNGHIARLRYYPARLPDYTLQGLLA